MEADLAIVRESALRVEDGKDAAAAAAARPASAEADADEAPRQRPQPPADHVRLAAEIVATRQIKLIDDALRARAVCDGGSGGGSSSNTNVGGGGGGGGGGGKGAPSDGELLRTRRECLVKLEARVRQRAAAWQGAEQPGLEAGSLAFLTEALAATDAAGSVGGGEGPSEHGGDGGPAAAEAATVAAAALEQRLQVASSEVGAAAEEHEYLGTVAAAMDGSGSGRGSGSGGGGGGKDASSGVRVPLSVLAALVNDGEGSGGGKDLSEHQVMRRTNGQTSARASERASEAKATTSPPPYYDHLTTTSRLSTGGP